ncbi:MAG TPA: NAD(P)-dependent oxidoreductase, partial [Chitinophagaceae bacterium]|nr:NAD(P)-dependent oxidoreductase [Chitinophagaceae bacterium]
MRTAIYSTYLFEKETLRTAAGEKHELLFLPAPLSAETALLARGCTAVCIFVNDDASAPVLRLLHAEGVRFIVLRSAGFNHVDLKEAARLGLRVARVPEYSPYAVAEHTVALLLALNRKIVRAQSRIREGNFSLDGLTGFDLHCKTVGIIGFGKIGRVVARILGGFGCRLLAYDPYPDPRWEAELGVQYVDVDTLCRTSDIITLHAP